MFFKGDNSSLIFGSYISILDLEYYFYNHLITLEKCMLSVLLSSIK